MEKNTLIEEKQSFASDKFKISNKAQTKLAINSLLRPLKKLFHVGGGGGSIPPPSVFSE